MKIQNLRSLLSSTSSFEVSINFFLISKKIKLDEEIREKEFNMYGTPSQILGIKKGTNTGLATGDYDQGTISRFLKIFL